MNIDYIHEPTDLQCGQAVLAMLLGTTAEYICEYLGNSRETDLREMKLRTQKRQGRGKVSLSRNESRRKQFSTSLGARSSALKLLNAGTGRFTQTAYFTTLSMEYSAIFRRLLAGSIGRYFPKH